MLHTICGIRRRSCAELIHILVQGGANVELRNDKGDTPLHIATAGNSSNAVKALLCHDVNMYAINNDGWMPAHVGCFYGQAYSIEVLIA